MPVVCVNKKLEPILHEAFCGAGAPALVICRIPHGICPPRDRLWLSVPR